MLHYVNKTRIHFKNTKNMTWHFSRTEQLLFNIWKLFHSSPGVYMYYKRWQLAYYYIRHIFRGHIFPNENTVGRWRQMERCLYLQVWKILQCAQRNSSVSKQRIHFERVWVFSVLHVFFLSMNFKKPDEFSENTTTIQWYQQRWLP